MRSLYFIINPKAGNGQCYKVWGEMEAQLKAERVSYQAFFTEYPGHAKKLAEQIADKNQEDKIMTAVGGDGTLHEVMNGIMMHKNIVLGFIPGGSGNDFSREFKIPQNPVKALKMLLCLAKTEPVLIDAGKINMMNDTEEFFINNMGVGFDAFIAYQVNHSRIKPIFNKLSLGRLVYVYFLLKELFTYKTTAIELLIDGRKHTFKQTWFITVSNQPYYGGGMKIAPDAVLNDGLLDIIVVHGLSRWKLLLLFINVFWGKHVNFPEVKTFQGRMISIQSIENLFVHGDGEHIDRAPLKINIQVKAVQVLDYLRYSKEADIKVRDLK
ncbi:diacylglycerol kinase family protein [Neobacillus mesonae]|uniref:diacylglycerol/lipid kinase family protein n=1 Tax=Neobacillus mesonae TaxID=1193713 RepID=UPI00203E398A|nr:diacylglycerol kinase family protein [Neobacillus mesonae]MCM3569647.1 diacylglycerol kinase family lipid kinase [Neobacillus mesonae]